MESDHRLIRVLKDDGFAETRLVEAGGERWVHKTFRLRFWWGRPFEPLARWSMRREFAISRHLSGIPGVAAEVVPFDKRSFLRRWVEGTDLKQVRRRRERPPPDFFDRLEEIVRAVHARDVAVNDLAKQDNVILTPDGSPVLIDFQISLRPYRGRSRILRALSGWLVRRLQREDLRHLAKMRRHVLRDPATPAENPPAPRRSVLATAYRWLFAIPFHALVRIIYPKGSNETSRFSRRRP